MMLFVANGGTLTDDRAGDDGVPARLHHQPVPAGVPIEWNVMVVYGGFSLFCAHPGVAFSTWRPAAAVFLR